MTDRKQCSRPARRSGSRIHANSRALVYSISWHPAHASRAFGDSGVIFRVRSGIARLTKSPRCSCEKSSKASKVLAFEPGLSKWLTMPKVSRAKGRSFCALPRAQPSKRGSGSPLIVLPRVALENSKSPYSKTRALDLHRVYIGHSDDSTDRSICSDWLPEACGMDRINTGPRGQLVQTGEGRAQTLASLIKAAQASA
jgi:hypothetical protein